MKLLLALSLAVLLAMATSTAQAGNHRAAARVMAAEYGWTGAQWNALDQVIVPESHWESCMRYPSTFQCNYVGTNSCGIPQASPCPKLWQGRLDRTWRSQIDWMLAYIKQRYGDPIHALAYRRVHDSY